jgi:sulfur carrier protein ThiS adenylyltransferase
MSDRPATVPPVPPPPSLHPNRDVRQREIVPSDTLAACHALVIGVGAIGRQLAIQLAAVGVAAMDLVDHDTVGEENLAPQAYWPADLGRTKVQATAEICRGVNPAVEIAAHSERFRRSAVHELPCFCGGQSGRRPVVFACVDSIVARELIWNSVRGQAAFYADARMSAEVVRVLASDRPTSDAYYPTTLFAAAQAYAGSCTAKSTVYTASIAAGLMVSAFTRWLRGLPVERDLVLNLLAAELTTA